jgi:hypothetical protein
MQAAATQFVPCVLGAVNSPRPRRLISFWKGFSLFWLMPRRYGPHLAAGSLRWALSAHLLSVLFVVIVIACASQIIWGGGGGTNSPRVAAARWILRTASDSTVRNWPMYVIFRYSPWVLLEPGLVLLAAFLTPWCAAGDGAYSAFKCSIKNVYWSTTLLTPSAVVAAVVLLWTRRPFPYLWEYVPSGYAVDKVDATFTTVLLLIFAVFLLHALLCGARERVGPADGPGFTPWEPRCDDCGYLLVGLPIESNCPECGLAVRDSLPGGRRRRPAWEHPGSVLATCRGLLREQWRVLWDRDYFRRLPVRSSLAAARRFWWATFLLMIVALLGIGAAGQVLFCSRDMRTDVGFFTLLVMPTPLVVQIMIMLPACLWGHFRHGIRDYRISAAACWYAAPLIWPMVLAFVIPLLAYLPITDAMHVSVAVWIPLQGTRYLLDTLLPASTTGLFLASGLAIPGLLFWCARVGRGLRAVRYANV